MKNLFLALALVCLSALFLNCEKADGTTANPVYPSSSSSVSSFDGYSSSDQGGSSSTTLTGSITVNEIVEYEDPYTGDKDGTWEVGVSFSNDPDTVDFLITKGAGEWQYSDMDSYESSSGIWQYVNWFFPSCSGDFEVTISYTLNGVASSKIATQTIIVDGLEACPESM